MWIISSAYIYQVIIAEMKILYISLGEMQSKIKWFHNNYKDCSFDNQSQKH